MSQQKELLVFNPKTPLRGMVSDSSPFGLDQGIFQVVSNFDLRKGTAEPRAGCSSVVGSDLANASYRGSWCGVIDGVERTFAAFRISTGPHTGIYELVAGAWVERSASGSRFVTDGNVFFAPIKTRVGEYFTPKEGLVIVNGTDSPMYLYSNTVYASSFPTSPITAYQKTEPLYSFRFDLGTPTIGTITDSTKFDLIFPSDPALLLDTTATTQETVAMRVTVFGENLALSPSSAAACLLSGQFVFAVGMTTAAGNPFSGVSKVEVYDVAGAAYVTLWDSGTSGLRSVLTISDSFGRFETVEIYAYDVPESLDGLSIDGFRLTCSGIAPAADQYGEILAVCTTGKIGAFTQFAVSARDEDTYQEGVAIPCDKAGTTSLLQVSGIAQAAGLFWPEDENLLTSYFVSVRGSAASWTDDFDVVYYATSPGGSDYGLVQLDGGTLRSLLFYDENFGSIDPDFSCNPYDENAIAMPPSSFVTQIDGRIYAAASGEMYVSGLGDPMWWSKTVDTDSFGVLEDSPVYRVFAGENVVSYGGITGAQFQPAAILVFTDRRTYGLRGLLASNLSAAANILCHRGNNYPATVTLVDGQLWFMDSESEIRVSTGGLASNAISLNKVGNLLRGASVTVSGPCAAAANDYFYVFGRGSNPRTGSADTLNHQCLVLDSTTGQWTLYRMGQDIAGVVVSDASGRKLYGISQGGKVHQLFVAGTTSDSGTAFELYLKSGYMTQNWARVVLNRLGIVADAAGLGSWSVIKSSFPVTDAPPSTIDMSDGVALPTAWREDDTVTGVAGFAGQFEIYGTTPACRSIYAMMAKVGVEGQAGN